MKDNQIKKRSVIYSRVSTTDQADIEFNSCEAQEEKIKHFIASQENLEYIGAYRDEGFSGSSLNRLGIQQLIKDIPQNTFDTILVYKLDRLTRYPRDFYNLFHYLNQYNIEFISITEHFDTSTPMGRMYLGMMLGMGRYEREVTGERVKDKLLERARKGLWQGRYVPFGYKKLIKSFSLMKRVASF